MIVVIVHVVSKKVCQLVDILSIAADNESGM